VNLNLIVELLQWGYMVQIAGNVTAVVAGVVSV
jgi:hypothetical protein